MLPFKIMLRASTAIAFTPLTRTYVTGTSVTETIPAGATNVVIEIWGGGGGGGRGAGTGCTATDGGYGGGGGYSRTSIACSGGQTLTRSVGGGGAGNNVASGVGVTGGATTVTSGTLTITTMTANGGTGGSSRPVLANGTEGTASGGTAANVSGIATAPPNTTAGIYANNPTTKGDGGFGGTGLVSGLPGEAGMVSFRYT